MTDLNVTTAPQGELMDRLDELNYEIEELETASDDALTDDRPEAWERIQDKIDTRDTERTTIIGELESRGVFS